MNAFLAGCELPAAWAGQPQWRILHTSFGAGLEFLAAWHAWKRDAARPRLLHFVGIDPQPVEVRELLHCAVPHPDLIPLAQALAAQWLGLLPGVHRLVFEEGRVLLTLHVRGVNETLRRDPFTVDSVFLDVDRRDADLSVWDLHTLKAMARHCRRGARLAACTVAGDMRPELTQLGFAVEKTASSPSQRHALNAVFAPAWEPKRPRAQSAATPGECVVIGGGLAGAAAAASLARRGWHVTVLDAADAPAAGASGLPAGLLAPHHSSDGNLFSRLTRSGVRATLQLARALLREGPDWQHTGVLERRPDSTSSLQDVGDAALAWTRTAPTAAKSSALLDPGVCAFWHEQAAWISPGALVRALLAQSGITWKGGAAVRELVHVGENWTVLDAQGRELASAALVVVAAAYASGALLGGRVALTPVRGQVSWSMTRSGQRLPLFPVHGNGHFIPAVPQGDGTAWYCGSTFERGETDSSVRAAEHEVNFQRLEALLPAVATQLAPSFADGEVRAWAGVRCASHNRRPLLGELEPGLWVSTAMGSRGLTFCVLCAELLASRLHDEPLPLESRLARGLEPAA